MLPDPIAEAVRLPEADILAFEARMREVIPAYQSGDRVELHGDEFEVSSYQREGMPGYWLRGTKESRSRRRPAGGNYSKTMKEIPWGTFPYCSDTSLELL